jgi:MoaA/NifB/PqqE/SkfB family radical SAM enzyme
MEEVGKLREKHDVWTQRRSLSSLLVNYSLHYRCSRDDLKHFCRGANYSAAVILTEDLQKKSVCVSVYLFRRYDYYWRFRKT